MFHVYTYYTEHCHSMYLYHRYTVTLNVYYFMFMYPWYTDTLSHWIPLHGYSMHYYFMFLYYYYIYSPVYMWLIVFIFLLHGLLLLLHGLLLHGYSCIPLIWLFPVTDIDNPVTRHECCWYAMWRTTCHVDLRTGATSRIPHFLFLIFSLSYFIISA